MNLRSVCFITLPLCALLTSCASNEVRVQQAAEGVGVCKTFDWLRPSQGAESFSEQHVRTAALRELENKGYTRVTEKPDCKITFSYAPHESVAARPRVGVGVGTGSGGVGGGIGVSLPVPGGKKEHGQFTLVVINSASNAEIWNGSVDAATKDPELTVEEADALVRDVLAKFPGKSPN